LDKQVVPKFCINCGRSSKWLARAGRRNEDQNYLTCRLCWSNDTIWC